MRVEIGRWLGALCLMLAALPVWSQSTAAVSVCSITRVSLAESAQVLRADSGDMTPEQIVRLPDSAFHAIKPELYLGHGDAEWWLRLKLQNAGTRACRRCGICAYMFVRACNSTSCRAARITPRGRGRCQYGIRHFR